jgi:hypothetical protein
MDSLRHPDLVEISTKMQRTLDAALQAEQAAANVAQRRQRSVREVALELEDRASKVRISTAGQRWPAGIIVGVGLDHLLIKMTSEPVLISFHAIQSIEPIA